MVGDTVAEHPALLVGSADAVTVHDDGLRYVGRGGDKLGPALDAFGVVVAGRPALDVGASTGGFTDCLLQRGASAVVAVDVGRDQLHPSLRADPRVTLREQTDIRLPGGVGRYPVVVADLSFVSLRAVAEPLVASVQPDGDLVALIKPQFEVGRAEARRRRGVVRDVTLHARALVDAGSALEEVGAAMMGAMVSPLRGAGGNVELLVHLRPGPPPAVALDRRLDPAAVVAGRLWRVPQG